MGILFNVLVVRPMRRWLTAKNADWQRRKDAGEPVFPLKPEAVFFLIVGFLPALALANALWGLAF